MFIRLQVYAHAISVLLSHLCNTYKYKMKYIQIHNEKHRSTIYQYTMKYIKTAFACLSGCKYALARYLCSCHIYVVGMLLYLSLSYQHSCMQIQIQIQKKTNTNADTVPHTQYLSTLNAFPGDIITLPRSDLTRDDHLMVMVF